MQATLSKSGDYGVRAVLALARRRSGLLKAREIAEEMDIPRQFLPRILAALVRAALLRAVAGPAGGYALAVPADQVTLFDVVTAIEGPLGQQKCIFRGGPCEWTETCPIHDRWRQLEDVTAEWLRGVTFAELATRDEAIREEARDPAPPTRRSRAPAASHQAGALHPPDA